MFFLNLSGVTLCKLLNRSKCSESKWGGQLAAPPHSFVNSDHLMPLKQSREIQSRVAVKVHCSVMQCGRAAEWAPAVHVWVCVCVK